MHFNRNLWVKFEKDCFKAEGFSASVLNTQHSTLKTPVDAGELCRFHTNQQSLQLGSKMLQPQQAPQVIAIYA